MKEEYFKTLKRLSKEIDELPASPDRDTMNKILYNAEEIVHVFNLQRSNYANSRKDLILDDAELKELRRLIKDIWSKAEQKDVVPRPEPDIYVNDLPK